MSTAAWRSGVEASPFIRVLVCGAVLSLAAASARAAPVGRQGGPRLDGARFQRTARARLGRLTSEAIAVLERLIAATGDKDPDKPDLVFRLAGHYQEKMTQAMFRARELDEQIFKAREDRRPALRRRQLAFERAERRWLIRSLKRYLHVATTAAFAGYRRIDEVLFNVAAMLNQQGRHDRARRFFRRLIRDHPKSRYIPDAFLSFAELYFERGQVEEALRLYEQVGRYPDAPVRGYALYKQGWCWLNLKRPRRALELFLRVIRDSGTSRADARRKILLVREARRDLVRAYSHVGNPGKAWAFFGRVGGAQAGSMREQLSRLYHDQGKFNAAITTLRALIAHGPRSDRLCGWQHRVLQATISVGDRRRQVVEARRLAGVLDAARARAASAGVLRDCARDTSRALRNLATTWHRECGVTKNRRSCEQAIEIYDEYLARFPTGDPAYTMTFYRAELLFSLERWRAAAAAHTKVVKHRPRGKHVKEAAHAAVIAWQKALDREQLTAPPAGRSDAPERDHRPRPISAARRALLAAYRTYARHVPNSSRLVEIAYRGGRLYYAHNHFPRAIALFAKIVTRHPRHSLAPYAANLLLDSLNILGRQDELEAWVDRMMASADLSRGPMKAQLKEMKFQVSWKRASRLRQRRRFRECGEAFARIANTHLNNPRWPEVLHNAAVCYEAAKLIGQAIVIRNTLISGKPDHPLARKALFLVGQNYHALAWYSRAAEYYEAFAGRFPGEARAPEALQNAIVFRLGQGRDDKARDDAALFIKNYGARRHLAARAAAVSFSLGAMYERRTSPAAAIEHYRAYLRRWGARGGVDRQIRAHVKLGMLTWRQSCPVAGKDGACLRVQPIRPAATRSSRMTRCGTRKTRVTVVRRDAARKKAALVHFSRALALARRLGPPGGPARTDAARRRREAVNDALAQANFHLGEAQFEQLLTIRFPDRLNFSSRDPKRRERAHRILQGYLKQKTRQLQQARGIYQRVIQRRVPHWSIASAARIGQLFQNFADALYTAPIPAVAVPRRLTRPREIKDFWMTYADTYCARIQEIAVPLEKKAVQGLTMCLKKSTELSWYNSWSGLCERELARIEPGTNFVSSEIRVRPDHAAPRMDRAPFITALR